MHELLEYRTEAPPFPQAGAEETSVAVQAAASKEPMKERTLDSDVFACVR